MVEMMTTVIRTKRVASDQVSTLLTLLIFLSFLALYDSTDPAEITNLFKPIVIAF
jgi:hypothetical protein